MSAQAIPDYLLAMVRRTPPPGAPVARSSTPVVAFGDPRLAEIATLGINPSAREFVESDELLSGEKRRLATLESLGADAFDRLTDAQVEAVVNDCAAYFQRQPYRRWFDTLDELLRVGADASYYDGSACHLDLVQWATDPVWGKIPDSTIRHVLLDDGVPHLRAQLANGNVRLVLLNGREVLNQVTAVGLTTLQEVGQIPVARTTCRLYVGTGGGVRWLGWSTNIQSSFGVSRTFKRQLSEWIRQGRSAPPEPSPVQAPTLDDDGYLPRGMKVSGKVELVRALHGWLLHSSAPTLGDVGTFGGRPWLLIKIGEHEVALNADTKRAAVEAFTRESASNPERPWRVVANRRGRVNKVIPNPDSEPLPGWYAYLDRPLDSEDII